MGASTLKNRRPGFSCCSPEKDKAKAYWGNFYSAPSSRSFQPLTDVLRPHPAIPPFGGRTMYDPTTAAGYVRLTIGDTADDPADQVFSDAEVAAFLTRERGPKRAAAAALDIIANSEALLSKKIRTQDLATDGPAVAAELRKRAASLRAEAAVEGEDADEDDFAIAPFRHRPTAPELAGFRRFGDGWLN